jgi:hypothetical protein
LFSPDIPVSSTNKTDHHDIAETLLKVALNTITHTICFVIILSQILPNGKKNILNLNFVMEKLTTYFILCQ